VRNTDYKPLLYVICYTPPSPRRS